MNRQDLISILGGAVTAPVAARAQQKTMRVIGLLNPGMSSVPTAVKKPYLDALRQGLSESGYVEGQNVALAWRFAEGRYDRLSTLAADLVARNVDVIETNSLMGALAAKNATSTIPIVINAVPNSVEAGLIASLSRPGGNITGFTNSTGKLTPKRLELLLELVPRASVIALLVNPNNAAHEGVARDVQEVVRTKGLQLVVLKAGTASEIDAAFAALPELHADALLIASDFVFNSRLQQIAALASRYAIPAIFPNRAFAKAGGLISYGPDYEADYRPLGVCTGRILKGEKPADLPVQQPTPFELVINVKAAKALGLTVPQSILAQATEVIE